MEKTVSNIAPASGIADLDMRSREIFRRLVDTYLETGVPVGSRTLTRILPERLSAASIRNVMADLEDLGLLYAPHTSAGRMPTETGLRLFVDGMMEMGDLAAAERATIESELAAKNRSLEDALSEAGTLLSGLSQCAGLVVVPPTAALGTDEPLRQVEFVSLSPTQALVVMVTASGRVENRLIDVPAGTPASALQRASNFVNAQVLGATLDDVRARVTAEMQRHRAELDQLTRQVVEDGLAVWAPGESGDTQPQDPGTLIVRGRANLLDAQSGANDLERIRRLFDDLETKEELLNLLGLARDAEGVRVFIGSENKLFSMSGSSLIVAPYGDESRKTVGMIGVIGPTRLNY
ncbi:MAG: heat-inducible transcriptional repressor HrcA, partial [Alphaproteobacteria bacterium]